MSQCPNKKPESSGSNVAAFCLAARVSNRCGAAAECFLTHEEIQKGLAVLDCGATGSLGGVPALEALTHLRGTPELDFTSQPSYTFGGCKKMQALCRAKFQVQADSKGGAVNIHAMDTKSPILAGIEALRAAGAIVDFSRDLAVFQKIDPTKVTKLPRASTGHLLLNLGGDLIGKPEMSTLEFCAILQEQAKGNPESHVASKSE